MKKEEDQPIDPCFWKQLEHEFMFSELQQLDKLLDNVSYFTDHKPQQSKVNVSS